MNTRYQILQLTPDNIADYGVCGYKDAKKHKELRAKIDWYKKYFSKGLRIKALLAEDGSYQGMIEYIPGSLAHRPVDAEGYMFIHCLFVGFKKEFKGKGFASALINECIKEAKAENMLGVAVVTRKGSFMADSKIFLKSNFQEVDTSKPDFSLLVYKFNESSANPKFKKVVLENLDAFKEGLTIMRSAQCPYTEKNVNAIVESAQQKYNIKAELIDLQDAESAQKTPGAFGTFCIIYKGKVISHHPISNTRFENIMTKLLN